MGCAECGCVVDAGVRVIPCGKAGRCCLHLPVRGEAASSGEAAE